MVVCGAVAVAASGAVIFGLAHTGNTTEGPLRYLEAVQRGLISVGLLMKHSSRHWCGLAQKDTPENQALTIESEMETTTNRKQTLCTDTPTKRRFTAKTDLVCRYQHKNTHTQTQNVCNEARFHV